MKTGRESLYRLMMLGVFMPKRQRRRLSIVYKLNAARGATVSLLSPKVAVLFSCYGIAVGTFFLNIGLVC
ncbi:MAG: hypothetical protein AAB968_01850 [Patescibacteria group bacterium]